MTGGGQQHHIGVVTGLPDLVNFLAVLHRRLGDPSQEGLAVTALLFGQPVSLPAELQSEFFELARNAFPFLRADLIPPERVGVKEFDAEGYAPSWAGNPTGDRIVYTNGVHKPFHQSFYEWLQPDEIHFFDNGLSSYADHRADIPKDFAARGLPALTDAYLTLHPPLPVPAYLSFAQHHTLTQTDFAPIYARLREAAPTKPASGWLPGHVIIGSSLFRQGKITWDEEREIYLRLTAHIRERGGENILYKAHPRASSRPLIKEADGVEVLDNTTPVEAFVQPGSKGVAYSISSTALLTLPSQFGWRALRIDTDKTRDLIAASSHLSKVNAIDAVSL